MSSSAPRLPSHPWKKERRVYIFTCEVCGHDAQSYKRKKVRTGMCRNCRKNMPDPNQRSLFDLPTKTEPHVETA